MKIKFKEIQTFYPDIDAMILDTTEVYSNANKINVLLGYHRIDDNTIIETDNIVIKHYYESEVLDLFEFDGFFEHIINKYKINIAKALSDYGRQCNVKFKQDDVLNFMGVSCDKVYHYIFSPVFSYYQRRDLFNGNTFYLFSHESYHKIKNIDSLSILYACMIKSASLALRLIEFYFSDDFSEVLSEAVYYHKIDNGR